MAQHMDGLQQMTCNQIFGGRLRSRLLFTTSLGKATEKSLVFYQTTHPPFLVVAENKMVLPFLSHFCSLVFYYPRFGKIPDFSGFFSRSHCLRAHISARLKLPLSICIALGHSRSSAANLPARQLTYGLVHWGGGCWGCVNAHSDQQPGEQSIEQPSIHGPECRPHHVANIWRRSISPRLCWALPKLRKEV